uniref:AarF domain-containing protein kinase n=1 Tax=Rhizophora mucronata TaxID=61149 RepID=A0A2P2KPK5_RHIMU
MAMVGISASTLACTSWSWRGGRISFLNPCPYCLQLHQPPAVANMRWTSNLNRRLPKVLGISARYYAQARDRFSSRLEDSIENLPKLVEDIVQTSIDTGPRGALRLVQGIQAFVGVGREWLADVSKVVHAKLLLVFACFLYIH